MQKIITLIRKLFGTDKVLKHLEPQLAELKYATLFHDTIVDSEWFKYKGLSLGLAAIDYGTAYVIYRVLEMMHPKHLLEFGLGQSSRIIHQYAHFYATDAVTYEHDSEWVRFFCQVIADKYPVHIGMVELMTSKYKGEEVLTYKNLPKELGTQKFDFVFVDGPFGFRPEGGTSYYYSRPQIIDMIESNLADSFCIIIHDYEREGEQHTISEVLKS